MSTPPRNRNPTYLIVAGVVISLLGAVLVVLLVSRPANITVPGATRAVVVTQHAVAAHAQLTDGDVKVVEYPVDLVPDHAVDDVSKTVGRFTVTAIPRGQPVTDDLLAGSATAAVQAGVAIPSGQVAVVIPPSDARSQVAGLVQSGDRVDILAHGLPGQSPGAVAATFTDLPIQVMSGPSGAQWVVYLPLDRALALNYLLVNGQYSFVVHARQDPAPASSAAPVGRTEFNAAYGIR